MNKRHVIDTEELAEFTTEVVVAASHGYGHGKVLAVTIHPWTRSMAFEVRQKSDGKLVKATYWHELKQAIEAYNDLP